VNKTAASVAQLANCILLYAYSRASASPSYAIENKQKLHVAYLTSCGMTVLLVIN